MDNEYNLWKRDPNPDNFKTLMTRTKPVMNSALQLYMGNTDDPAAKAKAKVLTSKAIKKYDPTKGTKLKTYLMTQLQPLRRFAAKRRTLTHIPEKVQQEQAILNDARISLEDKLDREPSDAELADYTGFSFKRIHNLRRRKYATPESAVDEVNQVAVGGVARGDAWTDAVYYDLPDIDRKIMEWRIGYGGHKTLTNNEIARKLRMTPAAVSQRVNVIAAKLEEGLQYGA